MKIMKFILVAAIFAALIGGAFLFGLLQGVHKMQDGLTANYFNVKNLVQGAAVDFDSALVYNFTAADDSELFNLLRGDAKTDTVLIQAPCYTRYAVPAKDRFCRVLDRDGVTEVWLPDVRLYYFEMKFDKMLLNGKPATDLMRGNNGVAIRNKLNDYFTPYFEKDKVRKKITRDEATKSLMFYFMPYGVKLKVYMDNEDWPLPTVVGINKDVDEAIREYVGAK